MTAGLLTTTFLPLALAFIMFGLGLTLRVADFTRVLVYPRAVIVGLSCQVLLLPLVCVAIAHAFGLEPALAVGLMLLAASPGGVTANLYSHLSNGDVALNITLTAINSILAIVTLPIIVNLSMLHFIGEGKAIPLQFGKVLTLFTIVLGPVAIGMLLNAKAQALTQFLLKPVKWLSILFLIAIVGLVFSGDSENIAAYFAVVGAACLVFNLASLGVGYWVPRLLKLNESQSIAIGMEIGIHNGTLAIAIALSPLMLNNPTMAIPAAIYSLFMFITAALFGWWVSRRVRPSEA